MHGTDIDIAVSDDGTRTWTYRGTAQGLRLGWERDTFWAPEVIEVQGKFHMYVSLIAGVPEPVGRLRANLSLSQH